MHTTLRKETIKQARVVLMIFYDFAQILHDVLQQYKGTINEAVMGGKGITESTSSLRS